MIALAIGTVGAGLAALVVTVVALLAGVSTDVAVGRGATAFLVFGALGVVFVAVCADPLGFWRAARPSAVPSQVDFVLPGAPRREAAGEERDAAAGELADDEYANLSADLMPFDSFDEEEAPV